MTAIFFSKLIYNSLQFNPYEYRSTFRNLNEMDTKKERLSLKKGEFGF